MIYEFVSGCFCTGVAVVSYPVLMCRPACVDPMTGAPIMTPKFNKYPQMGKI
jgi:hypothetical protein